MCVIPMSQHWLQKIKHSEANYAPKHSILLFHTVSESLFDLEHILAIIRYII